MQTTVHPPTSEEQFRPEPVPADRTRLEQIAPLLMRLALGIVFIWFGALKITNVTPVAALVADTLRWVPIDSGLLMFGLGTFEIVLGALLIAGWQLRLVLAVLIVHLCGTFLVPVMEPAAAFQDGNPMLLTTVGEFVLKNIVLIAAAVLLAAWPQPARVRA